MSVTRCTLPKPVERKTDIPRWTRDLKAYVECERRVTLAAVREDVLRAQQTCNAARAHADASAKDLFANSSLFSSTVAEAAASVVRPDDVADAAAQRVSTDHLVDAFVARGITCMCPTQKDHNSTFATTSL